MFALIMYIQDHLLSSTAQTPLNQIICMFTETSATWQHQLMWQQMGLKLLKIQEIKTGVHGDAVEYSRIGPSYETPGPRGQLQPVSGPRDRDSARLSERYEFSEPSYLGTGGGGSDG